MNTIDINKRRHKINSIYSGNYKSNTQYTVAKEKNQKFQKKAKKSVDKRE